jgi:hypothetical protein
MSNKELKMKVMYDKEEKELVLFIPTKDISIDDAMMEIFLLASLQSLREDIEQSPRTAKQFPDKQPLLEAVRLVTEYCTTAGDEV